MFNFLTKISIESALDAVYLAVKMMEFRRPVDFLDDDQSVQRLARDIIEEIEKKEKVKLEEFTFELTSKYSSDLNSRSNDLLNEQVIKKSDIVRARHDLSELAQKEEEKIRDLIKLESEAFMQNAKPASEAASEAAPQKKNRFSHSQSRSVVVRQIPGRAGLYKTKVVRLIAQEAGLTDQQVESAFDLLPRVAITQLKKTGQVTLPGIGRIEVRSRPRRGVREKFAENEKQTRVGYARTRKKYRFDPSPRMQETLDK